MTDDAIASYILQKTGSDIYYEGEDRIVELSLQGLKDFYNAKEIKITK